MANKFERNNLAAPSKTYVTEEEVRELIAAALANWTGITRFRTLETTIVTLTDFTNSQHDHSNAAGGGQINPANAFSAVVPVSQGGTGVNTLTGIVKGNGAGIFTAVTPLPGTKTCYVATSSGGAVTTQITFTDGVLTAGL